VGRGGAPRPGEAEALDRIDKSVYSDGRVHGGREVVNRCGHAGRLAEEVTRDYFGIGMRAVGIKQLKARLSEYLRLVKSGETILVTEREAVIAELRPARREPLAPGERLEDVLDSLAEAGAVSRASATREGWSWRPRGLGLPAGSAGALLDELRADRSA
jgi:antitoxin (DNA-binding transcriptional repressor) of toxin-antitoxin stability system